jgi:hypothetical protein
MGVTCEWLFRGYMLIGQELCIHASATRLWR